VADIVLIHGTTQSPVGWRRLVDALESRGHRAVTIDLAAEPANSVAEYADIVGRQVPGDLATPVVVAHSGSAPLLPAVARRLGARRQVWLASLVPDGRQSFLDEIQTASTDIFHRDWLGRDPTTDPVLATYFLFHDCDLETLQWALTTVRLFAPNVLYTETVTLAPEIPSTYVVALRDRALRAEWCRREAVRRLGADIVELDAGHCPHVSAAEPLAAELDRLARQ
jgi:pimeloyl-ACP methyl ester carboxylesterase